MELLASTPLVSILCFRGSEVSKSRESLKGKIFPGVSSCQSGKSDTFTKATALDSRAGFLHSNKQT